ncbi:phytoene/squalene synthase family protein [Aerococcaceae bacterium DSM 111021]|nr:phytoene/squalene synthase family protein [Aerococcaceae bacterium DSM 111021]
MLSASLKKDYAYCESVIKASSKSFYTAFSQLPKDKARAVYAIYAFCRQADDTVDSSDPLQVKKENLIVLEEELTAFSQGDTPDHPMWRALRDAFKRYSLDTAPFFDQLEGQKRDLDFQEIQTMDALKDYSYYVAGSVGLMLLPLLATKNGVTEEIIESGIALGIAMQLTNILRDIGEDYRDNHRVYLPTELMEDYGVDLKQIVVNGPNQNFINLWEAIAEESQKGYETFWKTIHQFDEDCQLPLLVAGKLYNAIMDAVRKNDYDCLGVRNYVPERKMIQLVMESKKILKKR